MLCHLAFPFIFLPWLGHIDKVLGDVTENLSFSLTRSELIRFEPLWMRISGNCQIYRYNDGKARDGHVLDQHLALKRRKEHLVYVLKSHTANKSSNGLVFRSDPLG